VALETVVLIELERRGFEVGCVKTDSGLDVDLIEFIWLAPPTSGLTAR
jgi:hypothetical protein